MKSTFAAGAVLAVFVCVQTAANAACIPIKTAAQLQAISNDLAGDYCLKNSIDLSSTPNFTPIGAPNGEFTGSFDGGGFIIRNLKINSTGNTWTAIGLFARAHNATITNVTLENVSVSAIGLTGNAASSIAGLVGRVASGTISGVHVTGNVDLDGEAAVGGLAGSVFETAIVQDSSSAANVSITGGSAIGSLIGVLTNSPTVTRSYATGAVFCGGAGNSSCLAGGLIGAAFQSTATVTQSFATGAVNCPTDQGLCGGLMGVGSGTLNDVYASGPVFSNDGVLEGGLLGAFDKTAGTASLDRAYSIGLLAGSSSVRGGLIGFHINSPDVAHGYWDTQTSDANTSASGVGATTAQLQAGPPPGFDPAVWGAVPGRSFPYLKSITDFTSPFATLVVSNEVLTFLPISQRVESNYKGKVQHTNEASLATCYTMIARAIGTQLNTGLAKVMIDTYWNDKKEKTTWKGAVTNNATLGKFKEIKDTSTMAQPVAELRKNRVVLLRGTYKKGKTPAISWMLATLFTVADGGQADRVVAHDPFTGQQVMIDFTTKTVVGGSPLTHFKVDGYQPVTLAFGG